MTPFALMAVALLALSGCTGNRSDLGQKVVLDVNGKQMTASNFAQELARRLSGQDAFSVKDPKLIAAMKKKVSEEFITQALTETWAKENSIIVKAEDLEAQIQAVQKSYPDDLSFQQTLAEEGINFKAWREQMQNSALQKMVSERVVAAVAPPTEAEIQSYYQDHKSEFQVRESVQIRQILVATESDAKMLEDQLKSGKSLAELAKKYSISPEASQGGNVGWIEKGLSDVFETAFHTKVARRSPIIKSSFGYHIFEVIGRKPARIQPLAEVKSDVKRILVEKRQQSLYLSWLEQQVRKARVFKDQAFIDALTVETKSK